MKTTDKSNKKQQGNVKPVQEAMPSSKQKPQGDANDLAKNEEYMKHKDDNNTNNSVGIKKK